MRIWKFLPALFLILVLHAQGKVTQVILRLNKVAQHDSLGYNILNELPQAVYDQILNGKAKLWDGPQKKIQIQPSTLKDIEKASITKFTEIDNIFIYQYWDIQKKQVIPSIVGILFATKNAKDEDVSFGYVEYPEVQQALVDKRLSVNANGYQNMNCDQVLQLMRFNYTILQFGKKIAGTVTLSEQIKNEVFKERSFLLKAEAIVPEKKVVCEINKSEKTKQLFNAIENYFEDNAEEYFNLGGNKVENHVDYDSLIFDKIRITETWMKQGGVQSKIENIVFFSEGNMLDTIWSSDLDSLKIKVGNESLKNLLNENKFQYSIVKINEENIEDKYSEAYKKALENASWSQLNYVVKENQ